MHQFTAPSSLLLLLLLLYATQSASLVLSNTPTSNPLYQGTPRLIQPANLIPPSNHTDHRLTWGTYHDIGSNLTIYLTLLGSTAPASSLHELLHLATQQVHDRAALFGPTKPVPYRKKERNLTQTVGAGLVYFVEPSRPLVPRRPGLEWGEFETVTSWLDGHLEVLLNGRACTFVLFRRLSVVTGQEVNLAFGAIKPVNDTVVVGTA